MVGQPPRLRRTEVAAAALVLALLLLALAGSQARAEVVMPTFRDTVAFSGLTQPTNVRFSPDGRVFVAEKSGLIKVFDSLTDTTPTTFADLRTEVYDFWDHGLLGLALDPGFPTKPYVYALYSRDAALGGTAPRWNDACPDPPGATTDGCVTSSRLVRLTASGDTATGSPTVLIDDWCQQSNTHSTGDLHFGPDGALYVSAGEGAHYTVTDYGQRGSPTLNPCGDPPAGVGGTMTPPTAEGGSLRAQDLRTPADPTTLDGAVLRVDPATGAGRSDNPLAGSADANARRIVAYGFRNPFRFAIRPGTSELWIGDVGWNTWEEINRDTAPTAGPLDFGWPCYEGAGHQPAFDGLDLNICENLYTSPGAVTAPWFAYNHAATVVPGESCPTGSSSISGVAFSTGTLYPPPYAGALFFADYSRDCIWVAPVGANGLPDPTRIQTLASGAASPVNLETGPVGDLYYADLNGGTIHHIEAVDKPPTAVAGATPTSGAAPLTVAFDATGSTDPDPGDTLAYAWDLDGDGTDDSTAAKPSFTYKTAGAHIVRLKVTDSRGVSSTNSITITVGTPPRATIASPSATLKWKVKDAISFSGSATDAQGATLPASALSWSVILHHCPGDGSTCHTHPVQDFPGVASGSFPAPDHDYPSYLEIRLTATDSSGLTDTQSVRLDPQTVDLTFDTSPTGLSLVVGSASSAAPFTRTVIVGSSNSISAPASQTSGSSTYAFSSWSDGGARAHDIVAPAAPATYTASYSTVTCAPRSSSYSGLVAGTAGLAGYWRLGEASGPVACATAGPNGSYAPAGATLGQAGAPAGDPDTSVALNGTAGFVSAPDAPALDPARLTLEAWVRPTSVAGSQAIARKDGQYYLKVYDGKLQLWLWWNPTTRVTITSPVVVQAGSWQHVVATFDGSTARLYRNGTQVFSQAVSGTLATTTNPLRWGDALVGGVDQNFLGGGLDEVAVYGTALSAAQVSSHYAGATSTQATKPAAPTGLTATPGAGQVSLSWSPGTGGTAAVGYRVYRRTGSTGAFSLIASPSATTYKDPGLTGGTAYTYYVTAVDSGGAESDPSGTATGTPPVSGSCAPRSSSYSTLIAGTAGLAGYWRLGEPSGPVACATAGTNGTYAGGTTLAQPGRAAGDPDTSVALDGSSGFVSVPDTAALDSTRVTVEAWVNPSTVAGSQSIARKDGQYYLKVYDGKLQGWLWWNATTHVSVTSAVVMQPGTWQHVALTFDGSTARLYRNGAQVASLAAAGKSLAATTNPLRWGDTLSGGVDQNFLGGRLDEVAAYGAALSASQLSNHYTAGR